MPLVVDIGWVAFSVDSMTIWLSCVNFNVVVYPRFSDSILSCELSNFICSGARLSDWS